MKTFSYAWCKVNQYETEAMKGKKLAFRGAEIVGSDEAADVCHKY